jgi:hypothetical protein
VAGWWELGLVIMGLSFAAFAAGILWLMYVAIEPYVRRHWPDALISWTRLQAGRLRDPLVASHIMLGVMVHNAADVFAEGFRLATGFVAPLTTARIFSLNSIAGMITPWFGVAGLALFGVIGFLFATVVLRLLIRRLWIADALAAILFGLSQSGITPIHPTVSWVANALGYGFSLWVLRRHGLLAIAVAAAFGGVVPTGPMTFGSWYFGRGLFALGIQAAIAAWGLRVVFSSRRRITGMEAAA